MGRPASNAGSPCTERVPWDAAWGTNNHQLWSFHLWVKTFLKEPRPWHVVFRKKTERSPINRSIFSGGLIETTRHFSVAMLQTWWCQFPKLVGSGPAYHRSIIIFLVKTAKWIHIYVFNIHIIRQKNISLGSICIWFYDVCWSLLPLNLGFQHVTFC